VRNAKALVTLAIERAARVDADLLINPTAPSIADRVSIDVGAFDEFSTPACTSKCWKKLFDRNG
jgi:hypothetical protein